MNHLLLPLLALATAAAPPAVGTITSEAPSFATIVPPAARLRVVAQGVTWAEGPVWVKDGGYLLFSDVPENRILRWRPGNSNATLFLQPSGGTRSEGFREAGSNGLKPGGPGRLVIADQGNRAIALLDLRTEAKRILADRFAGKRFNSPNDLAVGPDGAIWFTDPPYGLEGLDASPLKEQSANRVYRRAPDGTVTAVESGLAFPNGLAFSPDGRTLYLSNSDASHAVIVAWQVSRAGKLSRRRIFADLTGLVRKGLPGLPDGMTVDSRGDLWATGPGGIHVFSPAGRELGLISTGSAISNCTFGGADGHTLFLTSTHLVAALRTRVPGAPARIPKL